MPRFPIMVSGLIAAAIACGVMAPVSASAQNRVALVIGNDRYPNLPADKQLSKAVNDARAIGNALEKIGFSVIRGENLDRRGMVDRLFTFTQKIQPGDMAVVFYAGHGVAISGGNYLLPTDMPLPQPGEEPRVRN
ncbi:MAG: caspase family protein, partial [Rhizobiales bacterium]|nr:caspase family protein [Hyphomicrobiales bacterium]